MPMHTPPLLIALREALHQAPYQHIPPFLECVNLRLKVLFFFFLPCQSKSCGNVHIRESSFASEINLFVGGSVYSTEKRLFEYHLMLAYAVRISRVYKRRRRKRSRASSICTRFE